MMQTLNPYPSTSKTAEIMARYRPIAPKPEAPTSPVSEDNPSGLPPNIRKSPFLRNVWPHLQARPTRTRKRGRTALGPPSMKRARANYFPAGQFPTYNQVMAASPAYRPNVVPQFTLIPNLVPLKCGLGTPVTTPANSITLPLLSCTTTSLPMLVEKGSGAEIRGIDLNLAADVPEELDFMPQLQGPKSPAVITPQPVRPVGSSISIGCINEEAPDGGGTNKKFMKKPEEVEEEVEAEALPAVVSDSNNKVRLTNSAYKEMVGQPECCWLDYMVGTACKRIGGEVMLEFLDSCSVPMSSDGFTCWVKIEWGAAQGKRPVKAFCNAVRLACQSKDCAFEWRFHTTDEDAPESAASNI
ncbi:Sdr4p [Datura stramonium]|uniref:Sdr4p n=1 Tax=Datura stramonium TaxID=4076 RepID=A0ABS8VBL7_DATST|nr:Sdr4p [Datura stramonium]